MGKFSVYDAPEVDEQIQQQLDKVVRVVVETLPDVNSIILFGGFGRGEGSIKIVNGRVRPLKDYDIKAIVDKMPDQATIEAIKQRVYTELELPNAEQSLFLFSSFVVDVQFTTKNNLKLFPDISTYELKVASQVLYGEDVRSLIPWSIDDIPLSSGFRFLMEKMTGLIGHFPAEHFFSGKPIEREKGEDLLYECNKIYVEIATVLCLLGKRIEPSFARRAELFSRYYETDFPSLYRELPDLPQRVTVATQNKLKGTIPSPDDEEIMNTWFTSRHYLGKVLSYYVAKYLGVEASDWLSFTRQMEKALQCAYFRPIIANFFHQRRLPANKVTVWSFNKVMPFQQNLQFARHIMKDKDRLRLTSVFSPGYPVLKLYSISPLIVFSIEREKVNRAYLDSACRRLEGSTPLKFTFKVGLSDKEAWEYARESYLRAYRLCSLSLR